MAAAALLECRLLAGSDGVPELGDHRGGYAHPGFNVASARPTAFWTSRSRRIAAVALLNGTYHEPICHPRLPLERH
jgi:hypothetical protein